MHAGMLRERACASWSAEMQRPATRICSTLCGSRQRYGISYGGMLWKSTSPPLGSWMSSADASAAMVSSKRVSPRESGPVSVYSPRMWRVSRTPRMGDTWPEARRLEARHALLQEARHALDLAVALQDRGGELLRVENTFTPSTRVAFTYIWPSAVLSVMLSRCSLTPVSSWKLRSMPLKPVSHSP